MGGRAPSREPLDSGPASSGLPLSSDLCNGKTLSFHSMPRLLTHQAQLGLPPAAWRGDSLAPTLAFPMTPFKIHHVPSLGLSINNTPPPGAASELGVPSPGHPIWKGPALGAGTPWLIPWLLGGQGVSFLGVHLQVLCPPSGSCGRCHKQWASGSMKPWVSSRVQGCPDHPEDTTLESSPLLSRT